MIELKSIFTKKLTHFEISEICRLKNSHWKYNYNSQLKFFKKNVKKNDINNLLIKNKDIVGYTLLRLRTNKKKKIIIFDTLIIKKKYRRQKYSNILMQFNNFVIKNNNLPAYLICDQKLVKFYSKFNWVRKNILKKNKIQMHLNFK